MARNAALNKAAGIANGKLKKAHISEWNGYMAEAAAELGEKWAPRLSKEEREIAKAKELLARYPELLNQNEGAQVMTLDSGTVVQ